MTESTTEKIAAVPLPVINPNQAFEDGFRLLLEQKNPGYAGAFGGRQALEGFVYTREEFSAFLDSLGLAHPGKAFPEKFKVSVKFSPIALFKKWIFSVTNKPYLKVSEREKEYERDFYLFMHQDYYCFQALTTNIAHEKYLLGVFERKQISDFTSDFKTTFDNEKKIVVYKDYLLRKVAVLKVPQNLAAGKLHDVKIAVFKDSRLAKFRLWVNRGAPITQVIKLGKGGKVPPPEKPSKAEKVSAVSKSKKAAGGSGASFKSGEDFRKEAIDFIKKFHNTKKKTNKSANISLGRINKIQVLVNLAAKYKDIPVKLQFNAKNELVIFDAKDMEIKTFSVAKNPKSNWLERKKA
jgi:hypothetical protein